MWIRVGRAAAVITGAVLVAGCGPQVTVEGPSPTTGFTFPGSGGSSQSAPPQGNPSAGSSGTPQTGGEPGGDIPKGGKPNGAGVEVFPGRAVPGAKQVDLYFDPQCAPCGQLQAKNSGQILTMAASGVIALTYHPMSFLDKTLHNTSSSDAANAAFCAADEGRMGEFVAAMFKEQPAEGSGYPAGAFTGFASTIGLSGDALTRFTSCDSAKRHGSYVTASETTSSETVKSTPTMKINGVPVTAASITQLTTVPGSFQSVLNSDQSTQGQSSTQPPDLV